MKKYYCNNCKCEVTEKDTYCPNCGYVFDDEEEYDDEQQEIKENTKKKSNNSTTPSSVNQNKAINNVPIYNNYSYYSQNTINKKSDMIKTYDWFVNYGTLMGIILVIIGAIIGVLILISDEDNVIPAIIIWMIFTGWGIMIEKNSKWKAYMLKLLYEIRNEKK